MKNRVVVRGAGEMASGVIRCLAAGGYETIALEQPSPTCVRRLVCYAEAIYNRKQTISGVTAVLADSPHRAIAATREGQVALLVDPEATLLRELAPDVVVDARMRKREVDRISYEAPFLVGLGPGFTVGKNCHAAVETNRGRNLGRALYDGSPEAYSGVPAEVNGVGSRRVLRSPCDGTFNACCEITDAVVTGQIIGHVDGVTVTAEIDGILRGLIHDGIQVIGGQKLGDVDPRDDESRCHMISGKATCIGQGVLEAVTALLSNVRKG